MYIPPIFKETDEEKLRTFIRQQRAGILVTGSGSVPQATHLPFELVDQGSGRYALQAHLSQANSQVKELRTADEVLVIFGGSSAYVSPRWYDHVNVPTLNYVAVHAYGKPRLVEDFEEVYAMLKSQMEKYEGQHAAEFNITSLPEDFLRKEVRGLIGIEIIITRMEAAFKLSQNRDEKNYQNILAELSKSQDPEDQRLLAHMRQVYEQKYS